MQDEQPGRISRTFAALRRLDSGERMVALARAGRARLPGDSAYGDPLSVAGDEAPQLLGRGLSAIADERPSARSSSCARSARRSKGRCAPTAGAWSSGSATA